MRSKQQIVEEYLVAGARLGSRKAIAHLADLRGPSLLRHALRLLGNREDAQDAVQEAWIEIISGLPKLRDDRAFPAWAYRIVTRRAARLISGRVRRRQQEAYAAMESDLTVEETGSLAADARAVRLAIRALPPPQAAAISLFYLEDMSVAEVAIALDVPPGTIKTRLMHARAKLNQALKGDVDE
ncbi:sigma-70 family RNA polymerase sigma factor [Hoeflea sp. G2-23]|uniref:Sigma-70 family RNA polymerase sigma factor n=1 Tax=Hoeflea algicola TaxID=2983763 RepID=A0ABT3Z897_9HYPH|nr:sigma-70 family RNA polymerase sigma factor [Hoeflea algicola]MCY0147977.1 sigma-70 family RNA polymerase sigma factor [Hoeflea algicola]